MIIITHNLSIHEDELDWAFIRSPGPGGQNVNKVASAVQLRFNIETSSLPDDVKKRLLRQLSSRLTQKGEVIIHAHHYRSQQRNRDDAMERLIELIRKAASPPKVRKATRPTLASRQKRLESKNHRSKIKSLRKGSFFMD